VFQKTLIYPINRHILADIHDEIYVTGIMSHINFSNPIATPDTAMRTSATTYI